MTRFITPGRWLTAAGLALVAGLTAATVTSQTHGTPGRMSDGVIDVARPAWSTPHRSAGQASATGTPAMVVIGRHRNARRQVAVSFRAPRLWDGPQAGPYSADVIRTWHAVAAAQPTNPIRQSRVLAMVHAAMHDAVNGAVRVYEPYASWFSDRDAHPEAAAAAAAHRVLVNLLPSNTATFDAQLTDSLAGVPDGPAEAAGVALGSAVGDFIVSFRANDGMDIPDPFNPTPGPGVWEPTPPAFIPAIEPQMKNVTPFTIHSRDQFVVEPPPGLITYEYARDYNEVKALGRDTSPSRTADQTHAAHFWFEPSNVGWSRIAAIYTLRHGTGLHDTARLFALLNMAMADGYIAGFYWKQTYALWRPVTAIRKGDTDGNPGTDPDPLWNALRPTPPSPDYPSTHSVLGSAAAQILRHVTGSDRFAFCMTSLSSVPAGSERCFTEFSDAARENAASRVYIGYHFRFATRAGMNLGRQIGIFALRHNLSRCDRAVRRGCSGGLG